MALKNALDCVVGWKEQIWSTLIIVRMAAYSSVVLDQPLR